MLKKKKQLFPNMNTFRAANSRRVLIENIGQTWNIFELLSVLKLWIKNLYFLRYFNSREYFPSSVEFFRVP